MVRQLSSLDDIDRYADDSDDDASEPSAIKGMSKSQVKRVQAQSNKKPSKSAMPKPLRPKKSKTRKAK